MFGHFELCSGCGCVVTVVCVCVCVLDCVRLCVHMRFHVVRAWTRRCEHIMSVLYVLLQLLGRTVNNQDCLQISFRFKTQFNINISNDQLELKAPNGFFFVLDGGDGAAGRAGIQNHGPGRADAVCTIKRPEKAGPSPSVNDRRPGRAAPLRQQKIPPRQCWLLILLLFLLLCLFFS